MVTYSSFAVITQVFPDEFHLHTLDQFLSATARLNPHVNVKSIVIGLMDRLSNYAARESEARDPEDKAKAEEEATVRLLEQIKLSKASKPADSETTEPDSETTTLVEETTKEDETAKVNGDGKSHGIPDNVRLFEIFHEQVMNLVSAQRLPIQDITALLVSLANLAL